MPKMLVGSHRSRRAVVGLRVGGRRNLRNQRLEIDRKGETIVLEPYAPNILRVTLSLSTSRRCRPRLRFRGTPAQRDGAPARQHRPTSISLRGSWPRSTSRQPPTKRRCIRSGHPQVLQRLHAGRAYHLYAPRRAKSFLKMTGWSQSVPNHKDGTAGLEARPASTGSAVLRGGRHVRLSRTMSTTTAWGRIRRDFSITAATPCAAGTTTSAPAAPSICVPFLVTNKGYGLLWDNPSKTTIEPGFNEQTKLDLRGGRSGFVFRDRGQHGGRDLCRLQAAHRPHAHAAQGGVRLHPVQAALLQPGRTAGCRQGLSRTPSARGCDGGGLVLLHQDGPDGYGPEVLA